MADDDDDDIERLTLAALGYGSSADIERFRDELAARNPDLARLRASALARIRLNQRRRERYPRYKRMLDLAIVIPLLVILTPLMLFVGLLIRITSRGPAKFLRQCVGKDGHPIKLHSFRCMYTNSEQILAKILQDRSISAGDHPRLLRDPRITPVGRWIRRFGLHEWPALIDVLYGDISLIGPRPEFHFTASEVLPQDPGFAERMSVMPGLSGLADLLVAEFTHEEFSNRLACDLYYSRCATIFLDSRLLCGVLLRKLGGTQPFIRRICQLPSLSDILNHQQIEEPEVMEAYMKHTATYEAQASLYANEVLTTLVG